MKRASHLFDQVIDRDNLRCAFHRAFQGKRDRQDTQDFARNLDANLRTIARQLARGTYPFGDYHQFVVHDPKERVITAPCFAERVIHHAIMKVCEPVFERWLIADTFACRKGKGRIAAVERAQRFAAHHPAFLKFDVRKYFDSIDHDRLVARLATIFKDARLLDLFGKIIRAFRGDHRRGLPIGSLTSQHFANFYLASLDRFVKERLRLRGYVRYMDDVALWGESPRILNNVLTSCEGVLANELTLTVKQHPYSNWVEHGMDFLGCRVFPGHVELNRRSRVRFARKMKILERDFVAGRISEAELQQRATALLAFTRAAKAKSWQLRTYVINQSQVGSH